MGLIQGKQKKKEEPVKKELTIEERFDIEIESIKKEYDALEVKLNAYISSLKEKGQFDYEGIMTIFGENYEKFIPKRAVLIQMK